MTSPDAARQDGPLTGAETLAIAVLVAAGLIGSGLLRVYDSGVWPRAVALTALSVVSSFTLFWLALAAARVPPGRRIAGAAWALLPWNSLLLSQIAYFGFFFIPLEIIASALILRRRAGLRRKGPAFLLAAGVRLATLAIVYSARPVVRNLFPWR